MGRLVLGVDAGNHKAKVAGVYGVDSFKTNICNWFERDVVETFGPDDMEFSIDGRRGYAGTIAEFEDEFGNGTRYGDSKAHEETKIRVLLAVHRYLDKYRLNVDSVSIVCGQPIVSHKESEKIKMVEMLQKHHEYVVNGTQRRIWVNDVLITTEGGGAYWSAPRPGEMKILDIGSGTVNMVQISENRFITKGSGTVEIGTETMKNKNDFEGMARGIAQHASKLKWHKNDRVLVCGGVSQVILPHIKKHFPNAEVLTPQLKREYDVVNEKPIFANAIGFYNLARAAFK